MKEETIQSKIISDQFTNNRLALTQEELQMIYEELDAIFNH